MREAVDTGGLIKPFKRIQIDNGQQGTSQKYYDTLCLKYYRNVQKSLTSGERLV